MNRILAISLIIGLLILVALWLKMEGPRVGSEGASLKAKAPPSAVAQTPSSAEAVHQEDTKLQKADRDLHPASESRRERFSALPMLSAGKIVFYGKVVDQDGKPLPGVEVSGKTGSKVAFYQEEHREYQTTTDANGLFGFYGFKGDGLVIGLKKPGYNFDSSQRNFLYSGITGDQKKHVPDSRSPVVFTMFRGIGAEPMVFHEIGFYNVPINGDTYNINLEQAKAVKEAGDLSVSLLLTDHSGLIVQLRVLSGGLIEGGKDVMFIAPESGYKDSLTYEVESPYKLRKEIYVKSRNGRQFSRVSFSISINPVKSVGKFSMRVWLNPSGSRNLEYDPARRINR